MGFSRQEYWSGVPLPSPEPTVILISEDISLCQVEDDMLSWKIKFCLWIYFLRFGSSLSSYLLKRRLEYRKTELGGKHRRERRITEHQCVKAMAPHSSTLAWKIPWTEEPGGLQSMGSRRVGHNWATSLSLFTFMHWRRKWQPTLVFFPGESQGR